MNNSEALSEEDKENIEDNGELYDPFYKTIKLKRGGILVQTKLGNIQFGISHNTLKDIKELDQDFPEYYITPSIFFDKKFMINMVDLESPIIGYFYEKKKKVKIICSKENEEKMKKILKEIFIGSINYKRIEDEFHSNFDKTCIPNFYKEMKYFNEKYFGNASKKENYEKIFENAVLNLFNSLKQQVKKILFKIISMKKKKKLFYYCN